MKIQHFLYIYDKALHEAAEQNELDIIYYILSTKNVINEKCFKEIEKLQNLAIPPSITSIGKFAFN